jgi:hypothetical protein
MAVDIQITGLTAQQLIDIRDAFVATQGPVPAGLTQSQFTKLCILRYIKAVVKGWKRSSHETSISTENAAVETAYGDEVA